jgi:hypothetical protein
MDGVFENFEYSKFQDVNETIATTWLSIFIVATHIKKQHKAQSGIFPLLRWWCHGWFLSRMSACF